MQMLARQCNLNEFAAARALPMRHAYRDVMRAPAPVDQIIRAEQFARLHGQRRPRAIGSRYDLPAKAAPRSSAMTTTAVSSRSG